MQVIKGHLGRILQLALVFAIAYMLGEVFGYAFGYAPGLFPFFAAGMTLVVGGLAVAPRRSIACSRGRTCDVGNGLVPACGLRCQGKEDQLG
jgi:hypothetical protein